MIVGIPTDDGSIVSEHFGRSKYFLIANLEDGRVLSKKLVENPHNKESDDQAGHGRVLKMLVDNKVNEVVCFNLNPRMQDNLSSLKISVSKCSIRSRIDDILHEGSRDSK
jgi:predicted Fe-Mo cluster-binding NifX family protein